MFVDNKDFPCLVRGGTNAAFVLVCYKTRAKFKVDVTTKKHNGKAFRRLMALNGVHLLPYWSLQGVVRWLRLYGACSRGCGQPGH